MVETSTPAQLRAIADPLRITLLDLVLERAATVAEPASAVDRPNGTVAARACGRVLATCRGP